MTATLRRLAMWLVWHGPPQLAPIAPWLLRFALGGNRMERIR
jgi:hypothetical protein